MKKYKILSAALATAVLSGVPAMAQFNYQNGDLIVAFGNGVSSTVGNNTDVIVDLGSLAQFQNTSASPFSYNLSSVLNSTYGGVNSSVYWSAFGVNENFGNPSVSQGNANTIWTTLRRSNPANQTAAPHVDNASFAMFTLGDIQSVANFTSPGDANPGLIVDYAPGIELVDSSQSPYSTMMTSPYSGNFQNDWAYNVLNNGAGVSDLYQSDPGGTTQHGAYLGNFNLSSGGLLTFSPVPEPSTWAMMGTGTLAFMALRRRRS
jgi:hypothetical protein